MKSRITHWSSSISWLNSLFLFHLILSLVLLSHKCHLLLLVKLLSLSLFRIGAESLWTRTVHNNSLGLIFIFRGCFITHYTTPENAVGSWWSNLGLVSLMISHTIGRAHINIWSCSLCSHTMEHNLTLFIPTSFIIDVYTHTILAHLTIWNHIILITAYKLLLNILNAWSNSRWILSSMSVLHLTWNHILLTTLFLSNSSYNLSPWFLIAHSLLEPTSCFCHLLIS